MAMRMLLLLVLSIGLFAGCGNQTNDNTPSENNRQIRTKQSIPQNHTEKSAQEIADHLVNLAMSVPQVNGANCVVFGNIAIVGIDVDGHLDRSRVGTIKYSVAEALRKDPYGVQAIVTADVDMNERIKEISADIRNGKPVAGFANELGDMIGRLMPQLPKDVVPKEQVTNPGKTEDDRQLKKKSL